MYIYILFFIYIHMLWATHFNLVSKICMRPRIRSFVFLRPKRPLRVDLGPNLIILSVKKTPAGRLGAQFYNFFNQKGPCGSTWGTILSFVRPKRPLRVDLRSNCIIFRLKRPLRVDSGPTLSIFRPRRPLRVYLMANIIICSGIC